MVEIAVIESIEEYMKDRLYELNDEEAENLSR